MIEFDPKAVDARYTYDLVKDGKRIETFTTWRPRISLFPTEKIIVTDGIAKEKDGRPMTWILNSQIDIDEWHDKLARDLQWYNHKPARDSTIVDMHADWDPFATTEGITVSQMGISPKKKKKKWDPFEEADISMHSLRTRPTYKTEIVGDTVVATPEEPDTPIRPKHHRDVVPGYEYAEVMMYLLDDPGSFLLGTAYGYMFRAGKKEGNTVEQEMAKAQWYFDYYHAWLKNGKKVTRIKDIQSILKG